MRQIKAFIDKVCSDLMTPDDFIEDWYGAVTNQIGHVMLGAFSASLICVAWALFFGEMPYKIAVFSLLALFYAVVIEMFIQRSQWTDGFADTAFFVIGVCVILLSFSEVGTSEGKVLLQLDVWPALFSLLTVVVGLIVYIVPRVK